MVKFLSSSFFFKLSDYYSIIIITVGLIFYLINFIQKKYQSSLNLKREITFFLIIILISFCFSFYSGLNHDYGYHYETIKNFKVPIQIGFNRRFDNSHRKLKLAKDNGEIGNLEMVIITSRDPEPPGLDYLKAAGGFFRDTTIHDFDLSRFILGDDPIVEVSAYGSQLFSEDIKKVGDQDTAMFIMKSQKNVLIHKSHMVSPHIYLWWHD